MQREHRPCRSRSLAKDTRSLPSSGFVVVGVKHIVYAIHTLPSRPPPVLHRFHHLLLTLLLFLLHLLLLLLRRDTIRGATSYRSRACVVVVESKRSRARCAAYLGGFQVVQRCDDRENYVCQGVEADVVHTAERGTRRGGTLAGAERASERSNERGGGSGGQERQRAALRVAPRPTMTTRVAE